VAGKSAARSRIALAALAVLGGTLFVTNFAPAARTHEPLPRPARALSPAPCGTLALGSVNYTHVVWIWMENHSEEEIIGSGEAPYINSLASACGLASNYHNISHPSLPNYVAATSGVGYPGLRRFAFDCDPTGSCLTSAPSIFGQGETWRAYEESMPANCHKTDVGGYAVRHDPPPYFTKLKGCSKFDVPFTKLAGDLSHSRLPAFSFITPNLIDDMHDGIVADGNRWLRKHLPAILNGREYRNGSTAVFITWDEGEGGSATKCATNTTDIGCRVATIVISPSTKAGTRSKTLFNHYSLLGTAEQLLGLRKLNMASKFPTMVKAFHL
jgi:phosphatidylinositol-3-phosphatase